MITRNVQMTVAQIGDLAQTRYNEKLSAGAKAIYRYDQLTDYLDEIQPWLTEDVEVALLVKGNTSDGYRLRIGPSGIRIGNQFPNLATVGWLAQKTTDQYFSRWVGWLIVVSVCAFILGFGGIAPIFSTIVFGTSYLMFWIGYARRNKNTHQNNMPLTYELLTDFYPTNPAAMVEVLENAVNVLLTDLKNNTLQPVHPLIGTVPSWRK